jgi:hypothetical protein
MERATYTTKSFIIALALVKKHLTVEQAALAAQVEVASQIERWGEVEDSKHLSKTLLESLGSHFFQRTMWISMMCEDNSAALLACYPLYKYHVDNIQCARHRLITPRRAFGNCRDWVPFDPPRLPQCSTHLHPRKLFTHLFTARRIFICCAKLS